MDEFAGLAAEERDELVTEAASRLGLDPIAVEKDFWVCWVLGKLFNLPGGHPDLLFKGGTSLSKVYGLIHRFSEDIDITVSRSDLGFHGDRDPEEVSNTVSRKAGARLLHELVESCIDYVESKLLPALESAFAEVLGEPGTDWRIEGDPYDRQNLILSYPAARKGTGYIRRSVLVECGARSDQYPSESATIIPYVAQALPTVFERPDVELSAVLSPERTFLEKLLLLHEEAHRDPPRTKRLSRHYYDVAVMSQSPVREKALHNKDLMERVRRHKSFYFASKWRNYESARPGTLRLVPRGNFASLLRRDYEEMEPMFFNEPARPSFDEIIESLENVEREING